MSLLDIVVHRFINLLNEDNSNPLPATRVEALLEIDKSISIMGMWSFAKLNNVLDEDRSCEDFACEFMAAFNNEIYRKY